MKTTYLTGLALALSLAACDHTAPLRFIAPSNGDVLALLHLGPWVFTGFDAARRDIISDNSTLETTWAALYRGQDPIPPAPTVDFETEQVVLVGLGSRNTGGYSIEITRVTEDDAARTIAVREVAPGAGCIVTTARTSPADAMVLPKGRGLAVQFVDTRETRDCQ